MKLLQICLVQRVSNNLNVHFIQVLLRDAVDKERRQRRIDQHGVVKVSRRSGDMNRFHLVEAAERVAFRNQLGNRPLVQCARDQQNDVVDHVRVRDHVEERRERLHGMVANVLKLDDQLLAQLVFDGRHRQRRRLIGQEVAVVGALEM